MNFGLYKFAIILNSEAIYTCTALKIIFTFSLTFISTCFYSIFSYLFSNNGHNKITLANIQNQLYTILTETLNSSQESSVISGIAPDNSAGLNQRIRNTYKKKSLIKFLTPGNSTEERVREVTSSKWTKVPLIVLGVSLVFALGGLCALGVICKYD